MTPISLRLIAIALGLMASFRVSGQVPEMSVGHDVQQLLSLLEQKCGYRLRKAIEQTVTAAESKTINSYYYFSFFTRTKLQGRSIDAKMVFGCESPKDGNTIISYRSPREIIASEDAGGRYSRIVAWERAFSAVNWSVRIAYVDSVFGDGLKTPLPGFLLICPQTFISLCPSYEVLDKTRLKRSEVNTVVRLLETIVYLPPTEQ